MKEISFTDLGKVIQDQLDKQNIGADFSLLGRSVKGRKVLTAYLSEGKEYSFITAIGINKKEEGVKK